MDLLKYLKPMKNTPERFSNLEFWRGVRKLKDKMVDTFEYVNEWGNGIEGKIDSLKGDLGDLESACETGTRELSLAFELNKFINQTTGELQNSQYAIATPEMYRLKKASTFSVKIGYFAIAYGYKEDYSYSGKYTTVYNGNSRIIDPQKNPNYTYIKVIIAKSNGGTGVDTTQTPNLTWSEGASVSSEFALYSDEKVEKNSADIIKLDERLKRIEEVSHDKNTNITTFVSIAHQGYVGYGSEANTLQAFIDAGETGKYEEVETDVQFTSDDVPVLCHNNYISVNGANYIISEKTFNELVELKPNLCKFEDCIKICKQYNMRIVVDKLIQHPLEKVKSVIFPMLKKYCYVKNVTVLTSVEHTALTTSLLELNPNISLVFYHPSKWWNENDLKKVQAYVDGMADIWLSCSNDLLTESNLTLFHENCPGVRLASSVQEDLDLYKKLFYLTDALDSNLYAKSDIQFD